jgi:hypothetical protein
MLENISPKEHQQIQHIVELTVQQLQMRYGGGAKVLRGVHPKSHGCVSARFEILQTLPDNVPAVGLFAEPGRVFENVDVRFSNAATLVRPDSTGNVHGSRGMAIKLHGVNGRLIDSGSGGEQTQDLLMINQPVFAFANVEDYEVLSRVLVDNKDEAAAFFAERLAIPPTAPTIPSEKRALQTAGNVKRIQAASVAAGAFQEPPASPVDNDYFGAAPFLCGPDHVMRFKVSAASRSDAAPDVADENYLRNALKTRLKPGHTDGEVKFEFKVWIRLASETQPDVDIEDATQDWKGGEDPSKYVTVAALTIPLQDFDTPEQNQKDEQLNFTPWHCLEAHRPLGGINRLRRAVYQASVMFRTLPKFDSH